ncbi:MAG TPA: Lrp/AsnC family transcriptional regulator [Candidatus Thermoplasmatota archaeon]|nr:Lrp/AsnC family transcriptional regulator [Candidatus Thermoplasmatota archaeon]
MATTEREISAPALPACDCEASPGPVPSIDERDARVLSELAQDCEATVAFQGLRRRLHVHQQALARALKRLQDDGLVAHDENGYRLTDAGCRVAVAMGAVSAPRLAAPSVPILQALLPPHVSSEAVVERLSGRWFRGLRWYGKSEGPGETTLTWLAEPDGSAVRVRMSGGSFAVEAEGPLGSTKAFAASRHIVAAVADLYGVSAGPSRGLATLSDRGTFAA